MKVMEMIQVTIRCESIIMVVMILSLRRYNCLYTFIIQSVYKFCPIMITTYVKHSNKTI